MQTSKGFTVIELVVVIAIITAVLGITVANFPQVRANLSLARIAYGLEQDIASARSMALSSLPYVNASGTHQVAGYGVYINMATPQQYIIYADVNGDHTYDSGDYIVRTVDFSQTDPGINIQDVLNSTNFAADFDFTPNYGVYINGSSLSTTTTVAVGTTSTQSVDAVGVNTSGLTQVTNLPQFAPGVVCTSGTSPAAQDATCAAQIGAGVYQGTPTVSQLLACDVTHQGSCDDLSAVEIARIAVGLPLSLVYHGDFDGTCHVTQNDINIIANLAVGNTQACQSYNNCNSYDAMADMDGNGVVTAQDATIASQKMAAGTSLCP